MPFDPTDPHHDHTDLKFLRHVLLHPEMWPEGFVWKWSISDSCAIGLGERMGLPMYNARALGISDAERCYIFCTCHQAWWSFSFLPRPKDVARAIDRVLRNYSAKNPFYGLPSLGERATVASR